MSAGLITVVPFVLGAVAGAALMVIVYRLRPQWRRPVEETAKTRQALEESWNRLESAIESIQEGFILYDKKGRIQIANQQACEMNPVVRQMIEQGGTFEDTLRESVKRATVEYPNMDADAYVAMRLKCHDDCKPYQLEVGVSDGRTVIARGAPTPEGGMALIMSDVTDLKRYQDQLQVAKDKAEMANRAKSIFLANMSHELRTPLNAIIGFAEAIQYGVFGTIQPPQYASYISNILDSGHHLLAVIQDILDMTKIEAGKYDMDMASVDLTDLIETPLIMVEERAKGGKIDLCVDVPKGLPKVHADRQATKQIIINLLTNAIKFTPEEGTVTLKAAIDDEMMSISVSDTGVGMSPRDIHRAMDQFVQLEREKGRCHEGTGLGLPLSKKLTELQGGQLKVTSTPGKGTTVTVLLGLAEPEHIAVPLQPALDVFEVTVN